MRRSARERVWESGGERCQGRESVNEEREDLHQLSMLL